VGLQWDKQPSSRVIKTQTLSWTGSGTVVSTNFTPQTYQIRISTQVTGYGEIDNLGTAISTSSRDSYGFALRRQCGAAGVLHGDAGVSLRL